MTVWNWPFSSQKCIFFLLLLLLLTRFSSPDFSTTSNWASLTKFGMNLPCKVPHKCFRGFIEFPIFYRFFRLFETQDLGVYGRAAGVTFVHSLIELPQWNFVCIFLPLFLRSVFFKSARNFCWLLKYLCFISISRLVKFHVESVPYICIGYRELFDFIHCWWGWKKHKYPNQKAWRLGKSAPPNRLCSQSIDINFWSPPCSF